MNGYSLLPSMKYMGFAAWLIAIYISMAEAAAGFSPLASLVWTATKANPNDPMNKAEAAFYKKYDEGQKAGFDFLLQALRDLAAFEAKYYGMRDYYAIYAQPYYNFMLARYTRKAQ